MSRWEVYRPESISTGYTVLPLNPEAAAVRAARAERFGFVVRELRWVCHGDDWRAA